MSFWRTLKTALLNPQGRPTHGQQTREFDNLAPMVGRTWLLPGHLRGVVKRAEMMFEERGPSHMEILLEAVPHGRRWGEVPEFSDGPEVAVQESNVASLSEARKAKETPIERANRLVDEALGQGRLLDEVRDRVVNRILSDVDMFDNLTGGHVTFEDSEDAVVVFFDRHNLEDFYHWVMEMYNYGYSPPEHVVKDSQQRIRKALTGES